MMAIKTPNPTDKYVGARIRMRRLMLGMSQTGLAQGLDLTFQQIQKYEKGINRVGASRLQQIAHILKVPVEFFFEGGPGVPGAKPDLPDAPSLGIPGDARRADADRRLRKNPLGKAPPLHRRAGQLPGAEPGQIVAARPWVDRQRPQEPRPRAVRIPIRGLVISENSGFFVGSRHLSCPGGGPKISRGDPKQPISTLDMRTIILVLWVGSGI
jgi:transcriptional regulator with XRE-family HTH domain